MLLNQSIISDIKAIIAQSKDMAIRAVDHQRISCIGMLAKGFLKKSKREKI